MSLFENLKKTLKNGSEKVVKIAEDFTEKIKEVSEEGFELSKEVLAEISEKTTDITNFAKYKFELNEIKKNIDSEMKNLGELIFALSSSKRKDKYEKTFQTQINNIDNLKNDYLSKNAEYENLRKSYSDKFVIEKFSDELAENDAVIEQVLVSGNSNLVNKKLKELALPKEALISAIKRNDDVIIPDGNTKIIENDLVTLIGKKTDVQRVQNKLS